MQTFFTSIGRSRATWEWARNQARAPGGAAETDERLNSKSEIRNSKQFQMFKKQKILNDPFWIFDFRFGFSFVSDFDIRNSDFSSAEDLMGKH